MSQSEFRAALLDPDRPTPEGVTGPAGRPAGRRFDVYRNNVTVSLTEALRQAFPVIRKLVGEEFFTAMAREHLRAHPPASPLMMFYGAAMPAFLETFPPVAHLGYLPDIARLELALRQSYHAADAAPVAAEALQVLSPDDFVAARLRLAPAVRALRSRWPIHAIWAANARDGAAPKQATPEDVVILRPNFDPEPLLLPAGAAPFVEALIAGRSVGEALDAAGEFDLTSTLGLLIGGSAIVSIGTGEPA
ncbi:DNA-binding domain-containing protein [Defluviimonas sp. D31]|uniref:HvfC/BufC N-terminal domain-containing protein n=1 Tax=Defluviimonas sp. D31 TaxID=3083253 RepID=UPI00296F68F1|nr:DNA-binding domain-containing protein [Defluviimonas sp. D31]MDW4550492.1 DNA-binding domain-containing protein [Defluviimonas sp. D31]